jgi:hypothetical protein
MGKSSGDNLLGWEMVMKWWGMLRIKRGVIIDTPPLKPIPLLYV